MRELQVDVAVIGAGTAGLVSLAEVRKVTQNFVLIQHGPPGTTCARVGCMPSKAFIQVAHDYHRRIHFAEQGLPGADGLAADWPAVMRHVRDMRDRFTASMVRKTERLGERLLKGRARFIDPTTLEVEGRTVRAGSIIIATGSRPAVPPPWRRFGDRIMTSDNFFEQETLPASVAVIGLGVVGLELGQAMSRLGVEVTGIARSQHLGGISDPDVLQAAADILSRDMDLWRGRQPELEPAGKRLSIRSGSREKTVDAILAATGRQPNVDDMGLENLGVPLRPDGIPMHDPDTLRVGRLPVFIAGDANGARPVLHEAWHDGRVAGYQAVHARSAPFKRAVPLRILFTDPQIVTAGDAFDSLREGVFLCGEVRFEDQARALIMNENRGLLRLYACRESGRLLGAEMAAPRGEHIGHLLAWAIQSRFTIRDLMQMPFYHPVLEEGLRDALEEVATQQHELQK